MREDQGDSGERHRCHMPWSVSLLLYANDIDDSLGHGSDLLGLADTSSMSNIRLNDVDTASLEVRSAIKTREQSFPELTSQLPLKRPSS